VSGISLLLTMKLLDSAQYT